MNPFIVITCGFLTALLSLAAFIALLRRKERINEERMTVWHDKEKPAEGFMGLRDAVRKKLAANNIDLSVSEALALLAAITVLPATAAVLMGFNTTCSCLAALLGLAVPVVWSLTSNRRRVTRFEEDLGQVLPLISSQLRAGLPLRRCFAPVTKSLGEPIRSEFMRLGDDLNRGAPLESAIEAMGRRMRAADLSLLAAAVRAQNETGGNLADTIDSVGETVRARVSVRRMIRSQTSQARTTAVIMVAVPPLLGVLLFISNDMYRTYFSSLMGLQTLAVCAISELVGYLILRRMCAIRVD